MENEKTWTEEELEEEYAEFLERNPNPTSCELRDFWKEQAYHWAQRAYDIDEHYDAFKDLST